MIYIVDIESIENRYSKQWRKNVPAIFEIAGLASVTISGTDYDSTSEGGFFDFNKRMVYCGEQQIKLASMISSGEISDGDIIFYTDAFNPAVIATQYCIQMSSKNIKQYGYIHANSCDTSDILNLRGNQFWAKDFEHSFFNCLEKIYVATEYHKTQLEENYSDFAHKVVVSGCPTDLEELEQYVSETKDKIIVFPHRINEDKQPQIFEALRPYFPEYEFVYTQDKKRTKEEYYRLLGKAEIVVSFALHENYGIAVIESLFLGAKVFMPNDKSYKEMYAKELLYDRELEKNPVQLANWIKGKMKDKNLGEYLETSKKNIADNYCSFTKPTIDIIAQSKDK